MSSGRTLSFAATLCALAALSLPAQSIVHYAPGARRYHLISVVTRSQDVGGQQMQSKLTNEQLVSVALSAHGKDTLDFSYTMDSSALAADPPMELPDLSRMKGAQVQGHMAPTGKVYSYTSSAQKNDPDMQNLVDGMSRFLIVLPNDAKRGSTWVDTTRSTIDQNGAHLDLTSITTSRVVDDTTFHGQHAWRVRRSVALTMAGTQSQMGQSLTIDGAGTGEGIYYLSTSGVYLGSTATEQMQMKIVRKDTGQTIPVTQAVSSKVELLD